MTKLSPDKILSKRTFVLAGLLSQRLAARDKKSSTFYLWRAPTSAYFTLYLLAYVAARKKKLFRIKVDDKKLKRKAPSLSLLLLSSLLLHVKPRTFAFFSVV